MSALEKGNMEELKFRISSRLKSVIGRDLITDDFAAIFELVKNSFDAQASGVKIYFDKNDIYVVDDGKGMNRADIVNKWLFVAYSAKQEGTEDLPDPEGDYRDNISASPSRRYAGSKGVGRFSCDRLGVYLNIQSRKADSSTTSFLIVDWNDFEKSIKDEFANVSVLYDDADDFSVPPWVKAPEGSGTIIHISQLREQWDRKKLQELKSSLAKLINPFGDDSGDFDIEIIAPNELQEDQRYLDRTKPEDQAPNHVINGIVQNFIFKTLQEKTTWIRTWIDDKTQFLKTELTDRGKIIYRVSEPLPFRELSDSKLQCNIFYLNRAAKNTFARRMGVKSVEFGSVFLFKNGFRVYPIGDSTDDSFGIDRRKQQGYARFLGTRDVLGRIDVIGDESKFRESSSRDKGLIETEASYELEQCFWEKCLKRLERYVVGVSWAIKLDMDAEDSSFLSGDEAKSKVIDVIKKLSDSPYVSIEYCAEDILEVVNDKTSGFETTIDNLSELAQKLGDSELAEKAEKAKKRFEDMQKLEAEAIAYAEKERLARKEAEREAKRSKDRLKTEKEKNLFLSSQSTRNKETLEALHHQVIMYASNAIDFIGGELIKLHDPYQDIDRDDLIHVFGTLLDLCQHISSASKFATSANFKMKSDMIEEDIGSFIHQYIQSIYSIFETAITITSKKTSKPLIKNFTPIELSIVIDNLLDNAKKANAENMHFEIQSANNNSIEILVSDDGDGISDEIIEYEDIFERGVTTTHGSGIGLSTARLYLEKIQGSISVESSNNKGTVFKIRIYK